MISETDRMAWVAANSALTKLEEEREALLAPTKTRFEDAQERVAEIEERTGEPVATCEGCVRPIFVGDSMLDGETPLCSECAPTYADLLSESEISSFVHLNDDGEYEPMTPDQARELYDFHIASGGKPIDSMATLVTE